MKLHLISNGIEVEYGVNEGCMALGVPRKAFECRSMSLNAYKSLHKSLIVPSVMYGAEM